MSIRIWNRGSGMKDTPTFSLPQERTLTLDPKNPRGVFGGGRILAEILDWDGHLHVGLPPDSMPPEERVQGLFFNRGFEIEARILAPREIRDERLWARSLLVRSEIDLDGQRRSVGRLYDRRSDSERGRFEASLVLPEDALLVALTCLASPWRYIHIWTPEIAGDEKPITDFSFSRAIPSRLSDWVEQD